MEFISKLLQRKPPKQGGCGNSSSLASTPVTCSEQRLPLTTEAAERESPVEFTREFVEELVESIGSISEKTGCDVPHHAAGEAPCLKSVTEVSLPGSLPDLLLPEAAFKKHSDTDTDTTEYESAAETDPQDGLSHSDSLLADDTNVFEELAHGSALTSASHVEETLESVNSNTLACGDISILCDGFKKLNLTTPDKLGDKFDCGIESEHALAKETFSSHIVEAASRRGSSSSVNEINVCLDECDKNIPAAVEDSHENHCSLPTNEDNELACDQSKIDVCGFEEIVALETHGANSVCIDFEKTSITDTEEHSKRSDSLPDKVNLDAVIFAVAEVSEDREPVIKDTPVSNQGDDTYQLRSCDDISTSLNIVNGSGDNPTTATDIRNKQPANLQELSVPLLQGSGDTVQIDDTDYKLYENIIEISRLQERDLEKECCGGSTIKRENHTNEQTDSDNLCCTQDELRDFVNEITVADIPEFGNISSEAEKVAEEIFNISQETEEKVGDSSIVCVKCDLEDQAFLNMDERIDPFAPKSVLCHSPPPVPRTNSPSSSSSRGSSPAKRYSVEKSSPKTRSKSGTSTPGKESNLCEYESPRARSKAFDSSNHLTKNNEIITDITRTNHCIESTEDLGRGAALSAEITHNAVKPEPADDLHYTHKEVFREHTGLDFTSAATEQMQDARRESLYVKFDPLRATPTKDDLPLLQTEISSLEREEAVAVTPDRKKEDDPDCPVSNRALAYIDKLISLSPTVSKPEKSEEKDNMTFSHVKESEISVSEKECVQKPKSPKDSIQWNCNRTVEVSREAEMLNELQELRNMVFNQEQSYTEKIKLLESKIDSLEIKLKEKEEKESKLNKKITEMTEGQEQISIIMEEYERTISRLVFEKEQEKQAFELEKENLLKEKDTVSGHLENIEIAFSDVHRKYERSKDVIQGIKSNEEALRASLAEYEDTIKQQEQKYELLKSYATSQLESANQELESLRRSHQTESAKLHAMLKKAEIKASSLEEMLEQKIKENQELAAICDELIGKVGSSE